MPMISNKHIILLTATLTYAIEAQAIFKAFHSIDAEHCSPQLGMELVKLRFTQPHRTAFDDTSNDSTDGVPVGFDLSDQGFHLLCLFLIRTTNDVGVDLRKVVMCIVSFQLDVTNLCRIGLNSDT